MLTLKTNIVTVGDVIIKFENRRFHVEAPRDVKVLRQEMIEQTLLKAGFSEAQVYGNLFNTWSAYINGRNKMDGGHLRKAS